MHKKLTFLFFFLSTTIAMAQSVPQLINYQGFLKTLQPLTTIKLEFNIYDAATGGTKVWGPQIFNNVSVVQGQFNVILGSTDSTGKSIEDAFSSDQRFISLKINDADEVLPRQQVLSVGYSIESKHAELADKATQADNALNANHAAKADHATVSDRAKIADRATVADRATTASDPTVPENIKDGIHWNEISGIPHNKIFNNVDISLLTAKHSGCKFDRLNSVECSHAIRLYCQDRGYLSGFIHDYVYPEVGFTCIIR
jgi:hypothetical protein